MSMFLIQNGYLNGLKGKSAQPFPNPLFGSWLVGWLVGFVALRPKSTAMVIAGRSVHLTTLFPGQASTSG